MKSSAIFCVLLLLCYTGAATSVLLGRCPEGWMLHKSSQECRQLITWVSSSSSFFSTSSPPTANFDEARSYCRSMGGDLLYIDEVETKDWLSMVLGATGLLGVDAETWVGARLVNETWLWLQTGQAIDNQLLPWEEGGSGECAAFTASSTLIQRPCPLRLNFVCHRPFGVPLACDVEAGWQHIGDYCYWVSQHPDTWSGGEDACLSQDAVLLKVAGQEQQQIAFDAATRLRDSVWIGLSERDETDIWKWMDGTDLNYTHWANSQPVSLDGLAAAAVSATELEGGWVTSLMIDTHHYICQKLAGGCVSGWEEFGGSCYYHYYHRDGGKGLAVWPDALETCKGVGASLVVLDKPAEDGYLKDRVPEGDSIWLGLYKEEDDDDFYWTNDESLSNHSFSFMTPGDFEAALVINETACVFYQVAVWSSGEKRRSSWVPTDCHDARHFICEAPVGHTLTLPPAPEAIYCSNGWLSYEGDCYLFFAMQMSWTVAYTTCESLGADLTSLRTWAEQDFVFNHQMSSGWVGLQWFPGVEQHDGWMWSDRSSLTITNWAESEGEPSSEKNSCGEVRSADGRWVASPCSLPRAFTCRRPASDYPLSPSDSTTEIPDTEACDGRGWIEDPSSGWCYLLVLREMPFQDALIHCRGLGEEGELRLPELTSVTSQREQIFLASLVGVAGASRASVWVGLRGGSGVGSRAGWVDGSRLSFFNWASGRPYARHPTSCVEMYTGSGRWSDVSCDIPRAFVCKKEGKNYVKQIIPTVSPKVSCSAEWRSWNHNCYYFSQTTADWSTAREWCLSHINSDLVSVASSEENTFILGEVHRAEQNLWLGLTAVDESKGWKWVDGSPLTFTHWQAGHDMPEDGRCAQYKADGTWHEGMWTSAPCLQKKVYICKTTAGACREGWVHYQDKCYHVSGLEATWQEAKEECQSFSSNTYLASIHSQDQSVFLADTFGSRAGENMWIGLSYDLLGGAWHWSDETDVDYKGWAAGQPSHRPEWSFCAQLLNYPVKGVGGSWADLPCDTTRPFICQMPAGHNEGCESGWSELGDYCYWYSENHTPSPSATLPVASTDSVLTFEQARDSCVSRGALLASVNSELENQLVVSLLLTYGVGEAYLGMTDAGHPGQLAWVDGSPLVFTAWDALHYNPISMSPACVVVRETSGGWGMVPCSAPRPYICRKPRQPIVTDPADTYGCDKGDSGHEDSCYHLPDLTLTWASASTFCQGNGGYLVTLKHRPENAFLATLLGQNGLTECWIGLSGSGKSQSAVSFTWTNSDSVLFTSWGEGEPDVMQGGCVAATGVDVKTGVSGKEGDGDGSLGEWVVRDCNAELPFVCEYPRAHYNVTAPVTTPTTEPVWPCPNDWFLHNKHCYKVFSDAVSWNAGETECAAYGGHLASISSKEEEEKILAYFGESLNTYQFVWVGLEQGDNTGHEWSDGSPLVYVNWWPGQPEGQRGRYRCGAVLRLSMHLVDAPCHVHLPYICKVNQGKVKSTPPAPTETPDVYCADGWLEYNDYCYLVLSAARTAHPPTTWHAAMLRCRGEGGDLASIHSRQENAWLESKIFGLSDEVLWLGGLGMQGSGFRWSDNTTFDFNFWVAGEPDNFLAQEDCVGIYSHQGGRWTDLECDTMAGCVCKKPRNATSQPRTVSPSLPPSLISRCPEGWLPYGTKCVAVSTERKNFQEARQACSELSSLLTVRSPQDQDLLTSALGLAGWDVWLGLEAGTTGDGSFRWLDGSLLTYASWAPGEPDGAATGERCVKASYPTGLWSDVFCEAAYSFVCEIDQDPFAPTQPSYQACFTTHEVYISYGDACYRASATPKTWQDAETECAGEGGHLASVDGPGEGSFLSILARYYNITHVWIGLNNRQLGSQFRWSDGKSQTYIRWGPRQPDVSLIDQSCVSLNATDGLWYTQGCDDLRPALCKTVNGSTGSVLAAPLTGYCYDSRWVDLGTGYCYLLSTDSLPWGLASAACLKEGGQLASIHSQEEMVLVSSMVQEITRPFWLGLARMQNGYGWSDGTALDYLNWAVGEPDWKGSDEEAEGCVEMADVGTWSNTHCLDVRHYICKALKVQLKQVTNPVAEGGPYTPIPSPTGSPKEGPLLEAGGIIGIILAAAFLIACVVFVVRSYVKRNSSPRSGEVETASCDFQDLPESAQINMDSVQMTQTRRSPSITSEESNATA